MVPINIRELLKSFFTIIILFLFSVNNSSGQLNIPDFESRVKSYSEQNPRELVYLHTDREFYSAGDKINFKAYVRNLYNPASESNSENLHLILVDLSGNLLQEKIYKITDNQAQGEFDLINISGDGEYYLIAWTNGMETGPAENVFRKKIFVSPRMIPGIFIRLNAGKTTYLPGDIAQLKISLTNNLGKALKKKKFSYVASYNGSAFESAEGKTDKEGNASVNISLPDSNEPGLVVVDVAVEQLGSITQNSILIPGSKTPVWIDFAPEGGLFVDGFESQIGFRAYDFLGNPIDIEGQLLDKEDKFIKTIQSDGNGFGSFSAFAKVGNPLKVRLTRPAGIDIDFNLPEVQQRGIQLVLKSVKDDSLEFELNTDIQEAAVPLHAVAEQNGRLLFDKRFNLQIKSDLSVPLENAVKPGIVKISLLSRSGQVLAHRSVFLHGTYPELLQTGSNGAEAGIPTPKVLLKTINGSQESMPINFSVAAIDQTMAPIWSPVQDIMSWFVLGPTASFAAFPAGFLSNPNPEESKIIDNYMMFRMDTDIDWEKVKTGKSSDNNNTNDEFRDDLKILYQTGDFEKLIAEIRKSQFYTRYILDPNPGFSDFIVENKNALEDLGYLPLRISSEEKIQQQLEQGQSIMNVLMSVKPYKIMDGKIVFRGNDSFNYQGGVLIVIDGVPRGTDPGILNSISPLDVETLKASANISDIQKYSGLNSTGVIEITTKTGDKKTDIRQGSKVMYPTLYWQASLNSDGQGNITIEIPKPPFQPKLRTIIQGVDSKGNLFVWEMF